MEHKIFLLINSLLGGILITTQGLRLSYNRNILNWDKKVIHYQVGQPTISNYLGQIGSFILCISVFWWKNKKTLRRLKSWVNKMSIISLATFILLVVFNYIYLKNIY